MYHCGVRGRLVRGGRSLTDYGLTAGSFPRRGGLRHQLVISGRDHQTVTRVQFGIGSNVVGSRVSGWKRR